MEFRRVLFRSVAWPGRDRRWECSCLRTRSTASHCESELSDYRNLPATDNETVVARNEPISRQMVHQFAPPTRVDSDPPRSTVAIRRCNAVATHASVLL